MNNIKQKIFKAKMSNKIHRIHHNKIFKRILTIFKINKIARLKNYIFFQKIKMTNHLLYKMNLEI